MATETVPTETEAPAPATTTVTPPASDPQPDQTPHAPAQPEASAPPPQPVLTTAEQATLAREREAMLRSVSFSPKTPWEANAVAKYLSMSTLLPEGVRSSGKWNDKVWHTQQQIIHNLTALIMWGQQWNLPVWTAINVHIIDGKPTLPAAMMVAIVQESPSCHYLDFVEEGDGFATWETVKIRKDGTLSAPLRMSFTREQATALGYYEKGKNAQAAGRNQWNTQEAVMLQWRAATRLIRVHYPALIHGLHSTEEMIDAIDVGGPEVETIRAQRAEVDKARNGNPVVLGLGPPAQKTEMDRQFDEPDIGKMHQERQPEPVRKASSGDRLRDRAREAKKPSACIKCGGPINPGDTICDACRNE